MKKTLLFAAFLAAMTWASCQRIEPEEIIESPQPTESLVFTATTESSATKTALSDF